MRTDYGCPVPIRSHRFPITSPSLSSCCSPDSPGRLVVIYTPDNVVISPSLPCCVGESSLPDLGWLHNPSFVPRPESDEEGVLSSSSSDYTPELRKKKAVSSSKTNKVEDASKSDLYKIDRQPNTENLHYDSVYSGDVAVYRRKFDCLGLKPSQQLKWTDGRSKLSRKRRLEAEKRYFTERPTQGPRELAIPRRAENVGTRSLSDVIKIESTLGVAKGSQPAEELTTERYMSQLTGDYNRSLLEEPHNVSLWLEFLAFQDQLLEWGNLPGEASSSLGHKS